MGILVKQGLVPLHRPIGIQQRNLAGLFSKSGAGGDASPVDLRALGDFDDLEAAKARQDEAAAVAE